MFRMFYIKSMCNSKLPAYLRRCKNVLININSNALGLYEQYFERRAHYSILPEVKSKLNSSKKRHKNKKKLKVKPYEELLKVLEVHETQLRTNNLPSQNKPSTYKDRDFYSAINFFKFQNRSNELKNASSNFLNGNGVYCLSTSLPEKSQNRKVISESKESATHPKVKQAKTKKKKPSTVKNEELEKATKQYYILRNLKTYISVSINADEVSKASQAFEYYRQKYKSKMIDEGLYDTDIYNLVLAGWAQKGRLDKVKQIFQEMAIDNIAPNIQSYTAYFECISRCKYIDITEIQNAVAEMKSKGFTCHDILNKSIFVGDQKEKVVEILGFVDPVTAQSSLSIEKSYDCNLLEKLNDKSFEKGEKQLNFGFKREAIQKLSSSQMKIENDYAIKIKSVDAIVNVTQKTLKSRQYVNECEDIWRKKLTTALKNIKNLEKKNHGPQRQSIYPYLAVIDTEILVNLLLQEIRFLAETGEFFSPNVKVLYRNLGIKVMNHYHIWLNKKKKVTDKVHLIYQKYLSYLLDPELLFQYTPREYWEYLKHQHCTGPTIDVADVTWPHGVLTYIGRYLYDILRYNVSFNANSARHKPPSKVMSQAFYTAYEGLDVKLSKQIRTHSLLCKLYREAKLEHLEFDVTLVPMLSPPRPWVKYHAGGLLITSTQFIRFPGFALHQNAIYSAVPSQQLNPCFDSLNSLSLCPWKINQPILDLVIDVFRKGGNEELDIPLNPSSFRDAPKIQSSMNKKEKAAIYKQKMELKKKKSEMTSLWYDCLYKLSIANHFRDKMFWLPHNLDFRGRVYPIPPHFNHLGSDMARSILLFADGQPLGPKGLNWLKMHLINLTGFKKRDPHCERLIFANEMMPEILDSADRPFEGNQWWRTSDKPWQTLACCMEVAKAVRSPNPECYISHFPVHQDGSCNGLQHYAALGRDELGAWEVNLHPSDSPQDVYSGVAAMVEKERQKDAEDGVEIAKCLEGFVKRKVVKQTVMTFVYGVTSYGAKLQILKQLKDIPEFHEKYYHEAATYLMKKTFLSIREMFTATKQIQDWFTKCAEHITKVSGDTLEWVTPLGLPVIQPYHKETNIRSTRFCLSQGKEPQAHYVSKYEPFQLPNVRKQKNAFAPNFIHSLDSSHMMLTSLFCQRKGINFVSVHDCFWTHSSTVEIMNQICREQFVSLHKEPILENLSTFFQEKYARVVEEKITNVSKENASTVKLKDILKSVPEKGTFDLEKVLDSEYFFS